MLQLGLIPSHFNFRFRHIMHARRFGLGTLEFPPAGASMVMRSPSASLSALGSETMMVSGGVPEDVDMAGDDLANSGGLCPRKEAAGNYAACMRCVVGFVRVCDWGAVSNAERPSSAPGRESCGSRLNILRQVKRVSMSVEMGSSCNRARGKISVSLEESREYSPNR